MIEQKKSDLQLVQSAKNTQTANAVENPDKSDEILSQDELQAVSGGTDENCRDNYACGVTEQCAKKAFCNLYIL